jgi:hypothetical protein
MNGAWRQVPCDFQVSKRYPTSISQMAQFHENGWRKDERISQILGLGVK